MSDLISRQALCDDLREYKVYPVPISSDESEVKGYNDGIDLAISVIVEFPSAEPEQTAKVEMLLCGNCHESNIFDIVTRKHYKYCPSCGARLEWK